VTTRPEAAVVSRPIPSRPPRWGWRVVAAKEFGDGIQSVRLFILLALLGPVAVVTVYSTASFVSGNAESLAGVPSLFVALFAHQDPSSQVPSFVVAIGLLGPLLAIAFGFDAINQERSDRTLPRLVAQPIHRDAVIVGKFVARLAVVGLVLGTITLLVSAVAFIKLGVTVGPEEIIRLASWFVVTLAYLGFWLGFAMLLSVVFRGPATAVLAAIGVWIILIVYVFMSGAIASILSPVPNNATVDQQVANVELQLELGRIAPYTLYSEASAYLLDPTVQSVDVGALVAQQSNARAIPSVLPLDQSLLLAWPQVVALIALSVGCFGLAYVAFMRQEVRA
jgi:ABC-2 type transport system permease protein